MRKTVEATEKEFAALEKGFRSLSREIPINVNELNALGEAAGALGVQNRNIVSFVETVAKLGVTTNLSSEQAAEALARFANITRLPQQNVDRLGSTIVALGNKLASTEAEISAFGLRIAGAGKQVGLTESQILSFGGALSSVGLEAEAGGTAISTVLVTIAKNVASGGKKLDLFAKVAGKSAEAFAKEWRTKPAAALLEFIEGLDGISKEGGNVFGVLDELGLGGIRVRDALLRASGAGDLFRRSLEIGSKAWRDNNALQREAAKRFGTTTAQIQLARNNLNDLGISLGMTLVPALNRALRTVNDFFDRLADAGGFRGKLNVVWEGVEGAAQGATDALGRAVRSVDWAAVWSQARGIADGLQKRLEEVDWGVIGKEIGDAFADAVRVAIPAAKELAERVNKAVRTIDFEDLGKALGPGLAAAIVTAFATLADPAFWIRNWDLSIAVAVAAAQFVFPQVLGARLALLFRGIGGRAVLAVAGAIENFAPRVASAFLTVMLALPRIAARALSPLTRFVASRFARLSKIAQFVVTVLGIKIAINTVVGFAKRVGEVFANLGRSISAALDRAWERMKEGAIRAALAVVEPFSHLPASFGGWARDAKDALKRQLDEMGSSAEATATRIQSAIDRIEGRRIVIAIDTVVNAPGGPRRPEEGTRGPGRTVGASIDRAAANAAASAAGEAAATGSKIADAEAAAAVTIAAAKRRAAEAARRAAAAAQRALGRQREAFATLLDNLDLATDRAAATKGLRDDVRAARETLSAISAQIKVEGETADLLRQQLDAEQRIADLRKQIADNRRAAQERRQFRALGLSETGGERVPSAGTLGKRLAALKDQLKGTFLDTTKTGAQLRQIAKVLAGAFGKVGSDVRAAIKQMLDDIAGALRGDGGQAGPLTKFKKTGVGKMLEGVGLTPAQIKELRSRFAQVGPGGSVPNKGFGAFGIAFPAPAGAGAGAGGGGMTINLYGDVVTPNADAFLRELQRSAGRRARSRRGRHAGLGLGLG